MGKKFSCAAAGSVAVSLCLLGGSSAQALPLLSESASLNSGNALTLYPDHLDHSKFYFMPNSSKIALDSRGVPQFSLTYYGLSDPNSKEAGALMVYVGRLTSDPDQAQALASFLQSHPGAGVAVLPIMDSTIGIHTDSPTGRALSPFFTEFDFSEKGGRAEDEIGVNAVLTRTGAKVMKATILAEGGPALKMDECYHVQGLGPAMDGEIWVDMARVYDHFQAQASGGMLWWQATINVEVEKLIKTKNVRWQINGGDGKDEDYIKEATRMIVERMFKPELTMAPSNTKSVFENLTPFSFGGTYTHKEETDVEHWTITKRDLVTREYCVPLVIKDVRTHARQCVVDADATP